MRRVGRLVLDRTVDNFFAETEQVAFCTQNVVPGIDFTNDPLLQGRNFSYLDTQLKRLGSPNFTHLPVNAPTLPGRPLPAGRAHGDGQPGRTGQLRTELLVDAGSAGGSCGRLPDVRRAARRGQAAGPVRALRRPLQPGAPVLREPDPGRADPHRRRLRVRAVEVRTTRHPRPHGRQPAQRRRGLRPAGRRRAAAGVVPGAVGAGPRADRRPRAVTRAEHRRATVRSASPDARSESSSPTAPTPPSSRHCARRRPPRAPSSSSSPRTSAASSRATGSWCRLTRRSTAARPSSTTPWS